MAGKESTIFLILSITFLCVLCGAAAQQPLLDEVATVFALPLGLAQKDDCVFVIFKDNVQYGCYPLSVLETAVSKADLGEFDITHWSETTDVGSNLFFILKSRDTNTEAIAYVKHPGPLQIILDYVPLVSSPPAPSDLCMSKWGDTSRIAMFLAKNASGTFLMKFDNDIQALSVLGSFPLPSVYLPASPYFTDLTAGVAFRLANSTVSGPSHLINTWVLSKATSLVESIYSFSYNNAADQDIIGPVRISSSLVGNALVDTSLGSITWDAIDVLSKTTTTFAGQIGFTGSGSFTLRGRTGGMVLLSASEAGARAVSTFSLGFPPQTFLFGTSDISFPYSAGSSDSPIYIVGTNGSIWLSDGATSALQRQDAFESIYPSHFSALGILFTTTTTPSSAGIGISNSTTFPTGSSAYAAYHNISSCPNDPWFHPGAVTGIVGVHSEGLSTPSELVFAYAVSYSDSVRLEFSNLSQSAFNVMSSISLIPIMRPINDPKTSARTPLALQSTSFLFSHVSNGVILGAKSVAAEQTVLIAAQFDDESRQALNMLRKDLTSLACVDSLAEPTHYALNSGGTMAIFAGNSTVMSLFWFDSAVPHNLLADPSVLPTWNASLLPAGQRDVPLAFGSYGGQSFVMGAGLFQGGSVTFSMELPTTTPQINALSPLGYRLTTPVRSAIVEVAPGTPWLYITTMNSTNYLFVQKIYITAGTTILAHIFINATTSDVVPTLIPLQNSAVMAITLSASHLGFAAIITGAQVTARFESSDVHFINIIMTKPLVPNVTTAEPFFLLGRSTSDAATTFRSYWCQEITSCTQLFFHPQPSTRQEFLIASETVALISFTNPSASPPVELASVYYNATSGLAQGPYALTGTFISAHRISPSLALLVDNQSIRKYNLVTGTYGATIWTIPSPLSIVSSTMITLPSGASQFVFGVNSPYKGQSVYRTTTAFCDTTCGSAASCINNICVAAPAAPPQIVAPPPEIAPVPSAVVPICSAVKPLPTAVCVAGTWVVQGNVTLNSTANITGPLTINGSLILTNVSIIVISSQGNITVQGCVALGGSLTVTHPTPNQSINETIPIFSFSGGYCSTNDTTFGSVELLVEGAPDCAKSSYSPNYQPTSFSLLFSYDNAECNKDSGLTAGAIIGIVIAVVAVVAIAIAVTIFVRLRVMVHPFHEHEGNAEKRHSTL